MSVSIGGVSNINSGLLDLRNVKRYMNHLGFMAFKASCDIYNPNYIAEYDYDVREECIYGKGVK